MGRSISTSTAKTTDAPATGTTAIGMPALVALACLHTEMTRRDLGERLGRDARNLGTSRPKLEIAVRLADALGWPIGTLALASGDACPRPRAAERPSLHAAIGALDAGEPLRAVRTARKSVARGGDVVPQLCLVWALALRELQRRAECDAVAALAVESARGGDARLRRMALAARRLRELVAMERAVSDVTRTAVRSSPASGGRRRKPVVDATSVRDRNGPSAWDAASEDEIEGWLSTHIDARWSQVTRVAARAPRPGRGRRRTTAKGRPRDGDWLLEVLLERRPSSGGTCVEAPGVIDSGAIDGGALAAFLLVLEAILAHQRAMGTVDAKVLRVVSQTLQAPLALAIEPSSPIRWHDRMRIVRAEATRRRLVALMTGVTGAWAIGDPQRKLVVALIGRYPAFRRVGLRLLAETPLTSR